jgi:hypothetical protein
VISTAATVVFKSGIFLAAFVEGGMFVFGSDIKLLNCGK